MARKLLVNKIQLEKALGTLCCADDTVRLTDVLGVIGMCETWLTDRAEQTITKVPTMSQNRRLTVQLADNDNEN